MASNEWLVRKLLEQDKKIEALSRGGTGVGNTSLAANESLTVVTDNGEVVLTDGGLDYVAGVNPPTPTAPTLKLGFGTIEVTWDGSFGEDEDGLPIAAPLDLDAIEVHASTDPEEEEWGDDTYKGQIKTREGGTVTTGGYDVDDEVYVCLIALAKTGLRSDPSPTAMLTIEGIDLSAIATDLDAANIELSNLDGEMFAANAELDAAKILFKNIDLDVVQADDGTLRDALNDAHQAIVDAEAAANAYTDQAIEDIVIEGGDGTQTIYSLNDPSGEYPKGSTWYKVDSSQNIIGQWSQDGGSLTEPAAVWTPRAMTDSMVTSLNAAKIDAGYLSAARLQASSITADKLLIGTGRNLIPWSQVTTGVTTEPHKVPSGYATATLQLAPADTSRGVPAHMLINRTDDTGNKYACELNYRADSFVPAATGQQYSIKAKMYSDAGVSVQIRTQFFSLATTGYVSATTNSWVVLNGTPQDITHSFTMPSGCSYFNIRISTSGPGVVGIVSPEATDRVGSTLIEDGAITTGKVAANAIGANAIAANAIEAGKIAANAVTASTIAANAVTAEKIVALAVTADKLAANSVSADKIVANAVTSDKIVSNAVTTDKLAANAITAGKIDSNAINGMVITGATIRSAASGARVQLSASGIESFNAANERVFFAEANTGDVSMVGSFYSNNDGQPRVEIHNDDWASIGVPDGTGTVHYANGSGIRIGSNSTSGFSIYHGAYDAPGSPGVIEGQAGVIEGPLGKSYMALLGQGDAILASVPAGGLSSARFDALASGEAWMWSRRADGSTITEVSARGNGIVQMASRRTNGNGFSSVVSETARSGMYAFDSSGATQSLVRANVSGGVEISSVSPVTIVSQSREVFTTQTSGSSVLVVMPTAGSITSTDSANAVLSAGGGLRRNGSSIRYKTEVEEKPISEYADQLLSIPLKTWVDKGEYERRAEYLEWRETTPVGPAPAEFADFREELPRIPGVIAEELDEAGLNEFVIYDAFGRPESVAYDRLGPALIPIVRDLRDRITELERLTNE